MQTPVGWVGELHSSPLRMWVFALSGEMVFEASDGHRSRVLGVAAAFLAVVHV